MGIGASIVTIAVGAILDFAVKVQNSHGFNINRIGLILMIVGIVGLIISMIYWRSWGAYGFAGGRRTRVVSSSTSRSYLDSAGNVVQGPGATSIEERNDFQQR